MSGESNDNDRTGGQPQNQGGQPQQGGPPQQGGQPQNQPRQQGGRQQQGGQPPGQQMGGTQGPSGMGQSMGGSEMSSYIKMATGIFLVFGVGASIAYSLLSLGISVVSGGAFSGFLESGLGSGAGLTFGLAPLIGVVVGVYLALDSDSGSGSTHFESGVASVVGVFVTVLILSLLFAGVSSSFGSPTIDFIGAGLSTGDIPQLIVGLLFYSVGVGIVGGGTTFFIENFG